MLKTVRGVLGATLLLAGVSVANAQIYATDCTATGGTIAHVGGNTVYTFSVHGLISITCPVAVSATALACGAGGGGGSGRAAGAGGGLCQQQALTLPQGTTTGVVGQYGAAGTNGGSGGNGGDTTLGTLLNEAGGGGGAGGGAPGNNGGNGGGAAGGTPGQSTGGGNPGGSGGGAPNYGSGGGGGNSQTGGSGSSTGGANGGDGFHTTITGTAQDFGCGGGGGTYQGGQAGIGGCAGAGNAGAAGGNNPGANASGSASGGGGASFQNAFANGGYGADGIIVISHPTVLSAGLALTTPSPGQRNTLSADTLIYFHATAPAGVNQPGCGTQASPCADPTYVTRQLAQNYDLDGHHIIGFGGNCFGPNLVVYSAQAQQIYNSSIAVGNWSGASYVGQNIGQYQVQLLGDGCNPENAVLQPVASSNSPATTLNIGAPSGFVQVTDFAIDNSYNTEGPISSTYGAVIGLGGLRPDGSYGTTALQNFGTQTAGDADGMDMSFGGWALLLPGNLYLSNMKVQAILSPGYGGHLYGASNGAAGLISVHCTAPITVSVGVVALYNSEASLEAIAWDPACFNIIQGKQFYVHGLSFLDTLNSTPNNNPNGLPWPPPSGGITSGSPLPILPGTQSGYVAPGGLLSVNGGF